MGREQGLAAGQVDQDVAARGQAVFRAGETPLAAGRGRGLAVAVDHHFEGAEPAARLPGTAAADGKLGAARRHHALEGGKDQRDVQPGRELHREVERLLATA